MEIKDENIEKAREIAKKSGVQSLLRIIDTLFPEPKRYPKPGEIWRVTETQSIGIVTMNVDDADATVWTELNGTFTHPLSYLKPLTFIAPSLKEYLKEKLTDRGKLGLVEIDEIL